MRNLRWVVVVLAGLACVDAQGGTIFYTWHNTAGNEPNGGLLVFDARALDQGYISNAELLGGGFAPIFAQDLGPFAFAIDGDGIPVDEGFIGGYTFIFGTLYGLTVSLGASSFDPAIGGYWEMDWGGGGGLVGYGYWTAAISASGGVPEPPGLAMGGIALAAVVLARLRGRPTARPSGRPAPTRSWARCPRRRR